MRPNLFKRILKRIGFKRLNISARKIRYFSYLLLDAIGQIIFLPFQLRTSMNYSKNSPIKILIIRIDRIGDVILSTPAVRALRNRFPEAEIHMLLSEYTKDLLIHNPYIDKLLLLKNDKLDKDYDLAFSLHPGLKQNYLTFYSGAKLRVGYTGWGGSFFLTHKLNDDRETRIRHEVNSALEVVSIVGAEIEDKHLDISITNDGEKYADEYFKKNHISDDDLTIIIHPGARQAYIRWKAEGFAEVSEKLILEREAKVILIEGKNEKELVEYVSSLMKEKPLIARDMSLTQLVSLTKRGDLFIGNSTGPMHIAAALKIPVVAIFGVTHPLDSYKEWGPWGEGHIIVSKELECGYCHPSDCNTYECMKLITAEEVFKAAVKLISENNA